MPEKYSSTILPQFGRLLSIGLADSCRSFPIAYVALTIAIFGPLVLGFITNRQFYPVAVWSLFSEAVTGEGCSYYILRGESPDGTAIDIPAISLTDALSGRNHTMVGYVLSNTSLFVDSPHPNNARLLGSNNDACRPIANPLRINDLLHSWARIFNERQERLRLPCIRAIRLDGYEWSGKKYSDYAEVRQQYRVEL